MKETIYTRLTESITLTELKGRLGSQLKPVDLF